MKREDIVRANRLIMDLKDIEDIITNIKNIKAGWYGISVPIHVLRKLELPLNTLYAELTKELEAL